MASSGKFELPSVSPERSLYTSAQRGSYALDRSSSFRENMENPILSSLPSMSRTTSTVTHVDVTNFLQCLRFDPKSMANDHKFNRHGEFRRLVSSVLGAPDDSPSGSSKGKLTNSVPDDLKRLRAGLRESTIKARERVKIFSETLSVVNKCFPSIPSRKRSRPDGLPGDRSSGLLLNRGPNGPGVGKMGAQSHSLTNTFDFEQQKVEERGKNVIPNKRTRTSLVDQRVDVRPNTPARSSGNIDRDKETLRIPNNNNNNNLQNEDQASPIVTDGWEKSKMKKKRTGIKVDPASSPSSGSTKVNDGYREPKQGMHPRQLPDSLSRLNDSHGFRPGAANGVIGSGKTDGAQQAGVGMRSSIPRPEKENISLLHDKRDRSTSSEKERIRSVNKSNVREEFISGSPTSSTKLHTRGPRSGSTIIRKSSPTVRPTGSNDCEPGHGSNKAHGPGPFGSTNRKRTPSTRSSSPPVTQWADRRPQKISRTARRTNLNPILSNNDETTPLDTTSESGKRLFKSKGENLNSLSESEESGAVEIRSRDNKNNNKGKKINNVVEKGEFNVQKMASLVLPVRKSKIVNGEDGVRRQGRTGRGSGSVRAGAPNGVEKMRNVGTEKQLRTAKLGLEKSESKAGRPPTRKLSDRKAYTRQKHTPINAGPDFIVGSDDGHEELLAAAKAVINPNRALSSPFWRQMEPLFNFVSDVDISYLKQQGNIHSNIITTNPPHLDVDSSITLPNGTERRIIESSNELFAQKSGDIPLCQRLLAALISEKENSEISFNDDEFNVFGSTFEFEQNLPFNHSSLHEFGGGRNVAASFDHSYNGLVSDQAMTSGVTFSEHQYADVAFNERLLIEIQRIGIYPELVPDLPRNGNEGVSAEIRRLEEKHHEQVSRKKTLLNKLLDSTNEARELQEKEFEQHCLDKLTAMAYQKYMSCWGPHAPGGKSVNGKMAKQAALALVKRTLDRCHEFESTGKSCFNEPLYKEIFRSRPSILNDPQIDPAIDNEFSKVHTNSIERASGTQLSPSLNNHDIYSSSDAFHPSDQNIGKDDIWSTKVNKRELYLNEVVTGSSSIKPLGIGAAILNSAKGKRSERDNSSQNAPPKTGRPVSASAKSERKTKTKQKQKTTQLSGKFSDQQKVILPSGTKNNNVKNKEKDEYLKITEEPLDFSHLQLPEMDVLGEQGEDISSWLNIDDEILQDEDFMGLEIPMDDLTDLNMMV